ncbi:MAG: serpin family protein [Bacteroidaceae bacterium]|nr:serpin family protein [Bacteroidaceae bacterium]
MLKRVLYITVIAAMASCGSTKNKMEADTQESTPNNNVTTDIKTSANGTAGNISFWGELLSEACKQGDKENICLSPLSAKLAMSMIANGAQGETKDEICSVMQLSNDANAQSREFLDDAKSGKTDIRIANSIWIKENFSVKQKFIDTNREFFDARVENVPFNDNTIECINDWCKENTNGKIPSIIDRFTDSDRMILINALYFNAAWSKPFPVENTTTQLYTTDKGEKVEVPMMMLRSNASFYQDDTLAMTIKSYNSGYSMLLVLPAEGIGCDEAARHLAKDFNNRLKGMELRDVMLSLPKFRTEFSGSLKPMLNNLGIDRAFSGSAQFGGISKTSLHISDIIQKTYINVDEQGTEAAAVTGIKVGLLSMGPRKIETMTFDRPFIYLIINDWNNEVLFTGKVGNPTIK